MELEELTFTIIGELHKQIDLTTFHKDSIIFLSWLNS